MLALSTIVVCIMRLAASLGQGAAEKENRTLVFNSGISS